MRKCQRRRSREQLETPLAQIFHRVLQGTTKELDFLQIHSIRRGNAPHIQRYERVHPAAAVVGVDDVGAQRRPFVALMPRLFE